MENSYNWDATAFFEKLAATNKLARSNNFKFCRVSGLAGFEDALHSATSSTNFICVSDIAPGYTSLSITPCTRRVKSVYMGMRHQYDNMVARQERVDIMREIFRQFMTKLILEKTLLDEHRIYLDERINFTEIDKYFFTGCACATFTIAVDVYTDLRFNADEWAK